MLSGEPATRPVDVAARIFAIQGQDPRGARLAIRARSAGLTVADVDRAIAEERSLVITWLNRGTLHLVRSEDYPLLHALTAPRQKTTLEARLAREGLTPAEWERGVAVVERALEADGSLTRADLRARLAGAGIRSEGQATVHVLALASQRGSIIRGPIVGREQAFVLVRDWLADVPDATGSGTMRGHRAPFDREKGLAELARRYLAGHGPATADDLAAWAGLPLGEARRGLRAIAAELEELPFGTVDIAGRGEPPEMPGPRLLGQFEPLLHGWKSRDFVLGRHPRVITDNGIFHPFALVGGRAVARWRLERRTLRLDPFEPIPPEAVLALVADAEAVAGYLGRDT